MYTVYLKKVDKLRNAVYCTLSDKYSVHSTNIYIYISFATTSTELLVIMCYAIMDKSMVKVACTAYQREDDWAALYVLRNE